MANTLRRRSFLHGFVVVAASSKLLGCGDDSETTPPQGPSTAPEDQDRVFPQGLASGDPTSSSVMLWVRVEPAAEADSVSVLVEVAEDEAFSTLVLNESYDVTADSDHTLRVKLTELKAFTRYYYRFTALEVQSVVGRTKTAPAADTDTPVRFAFASCQDFVGRYYHSWKALAAEPDVDFVLFLGDYVYETNGDPDFQTVDEARKIEIKDGIQLLEDNPDIKSASTLADYRGLYKQYRRDEDLRAIHARYPFICIWDDHEYANDCWQDHSTDFNELNGDEKNPERRHAASQAWFEYQPADVNFDASKEPPSDLSIYRTLRYGQHVELILTDQRSYRADHVIPEGASPMDRPEGAPDTVPTYSAAGKTPFFPNSEIFSRSFVIKEGFDAIEAFVQPTMLGDTQRAWLVDTIKNSEATWKVWGNETQLVEMMLDLRPYELPPAFQAVYYFTVDQWDGYRTERKQILEALAGTPNVVALTGDIHGFFAAEIHTDPADVSTEPVLVEYVTAGISSSPVQEIAATVVEGDEAFAALAALVPQFDTVLTETSPEYKHSSSNAHGVAIVDVTAQEFAVEFLEIADVKNKDWDGTVKRVKFKTAAGSTRVTSG